jgi:hypothetical protein
MFAKKQAKLTDAVNLRKPRRWPLVVALILTAFLTCYTVLSYWPGQQSQPALQAQERPTEQPSADAAAAKKKKAESDAFWAKVNKENQEIAAADKARIAASNARKEPEQAAPVQTYTEAPSWNQFAGDYYYRYADKSEYDCSYSRCVVVHVKTMSAAGCPDGLYVEATVDAGGASVGSANAITASLPQGKEAIVKLTDTSGMGEKIALTELHCLGE